MFSKKPITMKVITLTEEFTALSVGYLVGQLHLSVCLLAWLHTVKPLNRFEQKMGNMVQTLIKGQIMNFISRELFGFVLCVPF